jgi:TatD DNase family protein
MPGWIDTHCHLDAPEFAPDVDAVRQRAAAAGVLRCVIPAVRAADFAATAALAHRLGDAYALGIHPLYVPEATAADLVALDAALTAARDDPHLVAVGEIGLDFFVPELTREPKLRPVELQLPVILHVRRSADALLRELRALAEPGGWRGIAHAFNGSAQQAQAFIGLGFRLGFGGAMSFERALQLRRLAATLPLDALVLETDAPDMPPTWRYVPAARRAAGEPQARNEPAELPRIAAELAALRGLAPEVLAAATRANACAALPRLQALLPPKIEENTQYPSANR